MGKYDFKLGTAKLAIPYPENFFPYHSWGPRRLTGVHDDLFVRAVYIKEPGELLLVSVDNGDIDPAWVGKLSETVGIPAPNILIFISHTHTAPYIGGYWPEAVDDVEKSERYTALAWETVVKAVKAAMAETAPAALRYTVGHCDVNICRDNPEQDPETGNTVYRIGRNARGYSDKNVYIMSFIREDGTVAAVLFSYSVHSSILFGAAMEEGGQLASGDLAGYAMDSVEKSLGHGAVALFAMAPAADQNPRYMAMYEYTGENGEKAHGNYGPASYTLVELQGGDLAEAVLAALDGRAGTVMDRPSAVAGVGSVRGAAAELPSAVAGVGSVQGASERQAGADAGAAVTSSAIPGANAAVTSTAAPGADAPFEVKTVSETIYVPGKVKKEGRGIKWPQSPAEYEPAEDVPIPLSVTAIGGVGIVSIGCETSSVNAPEIRRILAEKGFSDTIIITQCNGSSSYMSDAHGYQVVTFSAMASHMMPQAVDRMFEGVEKLAAAVASGK
ncbi:MAG: hypothetical protein LBR77_06895 [Lachnospiraceae bacterium]|jgi:hypothetical protein|nr:hypothetical protein [Lachnospiraceae bacterium]